MSVGKRLREERLRLKLSQEEFGQLGGVAKIAQFNYEKSKRRPDIDYLEKIYKNGVDILYVVTGRRDDFSKDEVELINLFREAPLKKKIIILNLLSESSD